MAVGRHLRPRGKRTAAQRVRVVENLVRADDARLLPAEVHGPVAPVAYLGQCRDGLSSDQHRPAFCERAPLLARAPQARRETPLGGRLALCGPSARSGIRRLDGRAEERALAPTAPARARCLYRL